MAWLCPAFNRPVLLPHRLFSSADVPSFAQDGNHTPGNGLLIFFRVDDFDKALTRARTLVTRLEEEPHMSPNTGTKEFALRDPDGYYVMVSAWSAA
jgi:hypothetical protein